MDLSPILQRDPQKLGTEPALNELGSLQGKCMTSVNHLPPLLSFVWQKVRTVPKVPGVV